MNSIKNKLIIICTLSVIILFGLGYLIIHDLRHEYANHPTPSPSSTSSMSTNEPTPSQSPVPTSSPDVTASPSTTVKNLITVDDDSSISRLINLENDVSSNYVPDNLVESSLSNRDIYLRNDCEIALEQMFAAASESGYDLYLISGYRSYATQEMLYNYYVDLYGEEEANLIDCHPGASEHQLGLAVDLGRSDHMYELDTDFATTAEYTWLMEHCHEYGFILRYPEDKENITNIMYSPWHYRYVGLELASELHDRNMTMEEYYALQTQ